MSSDLTVSLTLKQRDELSRPTERTLQGVVKQSQEAVRSVEAVATASAHTAAAREQSSNQSERAIQRNLSETAAAYSEQEKTAVEAERAIARETNRSIDQRLRTQEQFYGALRELGVRSEQEIRREIEQTELAYARVAESGMASAQEQARAFDATRRKVAELREEMGALSTAQPGIARRGLGFARRGVGYAIGAGELALAGAAATHVIAGPVDRAMSFDQRIALMANTAFNDEDASGRIREMQTLRDVVKKTIAKGGGTPDEVVAAMTQLLGQNAISHESAFRLMPVLQRYATATGSDTTELGDIAMRSIQNFGIREEQIPAVLDAAIKGGHMGGFHLRQMAKWLPQQMASAKNSGMSGMDGLSTLIALNEVSMTTAGTADEAGNNVLDLMQHLNSHDTAHQIKRELGATLAVRLAEARGKGQNSVEAFGGLIDQVMAKDKNYQIIKKKIASTKDDGEKRELYESMQQILAGSAIGKVIRNRQEMLAMMGYLNNRDRFNAIKNASAHALGTGETDAKVMESTDAFKTERAKSMAELGEMDSLRGFDHVIGNAADKVTQYAQQYPGLISSIMGTKVAFEGVTSALGAFGLLRMLTGHGAGAAAAEGAEAVAATAGSSALAGIAQGAGRFGRFARGGSAALSILAGGFEAWNVAHDNSMSAADKHAAYVGVAGGAAGAIGGMAAGAAIGTALFPGVGTLAGAIGGGLLGFAGHEGGEAIGKWIGDAIFKAESAKAANPQPATINVKVNLDGQQLFETVHQIMLSEARRR